MNLIDIGDNVLVNIDLITGIRFSRDAEGRSSNVIIHAGGEVFTSNMPVEYILSMLKSVNSNTQYWAGR